MNPFVIQTAGLTRYFGDFCAVDQVTLAVPRGCVLALLGRNGSGKTTLIRMMLGMLTPTRGWAKVLGEDCRHIDPTTRGRIGYVAEGQPLFTWMRIGELEAFQKSYYPAWDSRMFQTVLDHFALSRTARARRLSRGQQAGLSLALTLASKPELLVMDDPAMGLDPVARRTLLEAMILVTRDAGHTIFFSSHVLGDVERVADRVAILDRSVLRVCCSVEVLQNRVKRMVLRFAGSSPATGSLPGLLESVRDGNEVQVTLANYGPAAREAVEGLGAMSMEEVPMSLEDIVIAYLGERGERVSLLQKTQEAGVA